MRDACPEMHGGGFLPPPDLTHHAAGDTAGQTYDIEMSPPVDAEPAKVCGVMGTHPPDHSLGAGCHIVRRQESVQRRMPEFRQLLVRLSQRAGLSFPRTEAHGITACAIGAAAALAIIDGRVPDVCRDVGTDPPDSYPRTEGDVIWCKEAVSGRMPAGGQGWGASAETAMVEGSIMSETISQRTTATATPFPTA